MHINLFTIVFIFIAFSITHAQTRQYLLHPRDHFSTNITIKPSDVSTLVTLNAAATAPFDVYIMSPAQYVEYSIFAPKGLEFDYDKENSRIGEKFVELKNVEIFENVSQIVMFNPGKSVITITYSIITKGQSYKFGKLNTLSFIL